MDDLRFRVTHFLRSLTWHRRLLAGGLAAAGVAIAIEAAQPDPPPTSPVVVAATSLDGGTVIDADDVTTAELPPSTVPEGALEKSDVVGRTTSGPLNAREVLTDARLVGEAAVAGWGDDLVATPVRLADPASAVVVRPGDHIDVLAAAADGLGESRVIAASVPVLTVLEGGDDTVSDGPLLVVAATSDQALAIAGAAAGSHLSYTLLP